MGPTPLIQVKVEYSAPFTLRSLSNDHEPPHWRRTTDGTEQDQRQFFKDIGATAEQTVEEIRGVEEDYFALLQNMLIAFPWIADIATRMQRIRPKLCGCFSVFSRV